MSCNEISHQRDSRDDSQSHSANDEITDMSELQRRPSRMISVLLFVSVVAIQFNFALRRLISWSTRSVDKLISLPLSLILLVLAATHETLLRLAVSGGETVSYERLDNAFWVDGGASIAVNRTFEYFIDRTEEDVVTASGPSTEEKHEDIHKPSLKTSTNVSLHSRFYLDILGIYKPPKRSERQSTIELVSCSS